MIGFIKFRNVAKLPSRRMFSALPSGVDSINVTERSNGVFNVELNRPEQRNSFTVKVWEDLGKVFNHLSDYSKCRSIVLTGAGKSFCAGIDLKEGFADLISIINDDSMDVARKSRQIRGFIRTCQDGYTTLEKCQKPVICAIHSHCFGAGTSLISCCDIRFATKDTIFSIKEVDVGLAADVGVLQRLDKITGNDSWGREIAFTARDFGASEALKFGFVSRVFDTRTECVDCAFDLAESIASKSPVAVQGTKLAMNYARNHSVDDALEWMLTWNQSQLQTEDIVQSATARISKQKPEFNDA